MNDMETKLDTHIETDWFKACREGNVVVFSFKGNFLLNATTVSYTHLTLPTN